MRSRARDSKFPVLGSGQPHVITMPLKQGGLLGSGYSGHSNDTEDWETNQATLRAGAGEACDLTEGPWEQGLKARWEGEATGTQSSGGW